jgi:hypothetical protein
MPMFWLAACTVDQPALVGVPVSAGGAWTGAATLDGVPVRLDEASVTFADLRLKAPAAPVVRFGGFGAAAWAHPGHDFAGDVVGELLGSFTVDLLGEDTPIGEATCYAGATETATIQLAGEVRLVGVATVDGVDRPFRLIVTEDTLVDGIPFEATIAAESPSPLLVLADPAELLSHVDLRTPDADGDGALTIADGVVENTLRFGARSVLAWSITAE